MFLLLEWESIFKQISVHPFLIEIAFWILWSFLLFFSNSLLLLRILSAHIRGHNTPTDLSPAARMEELLCFTCEYEISFYVTVFWKSDLFTHV